jgi:hypothetical protein
MRERLGKAARRDVARFDISRIVEQWECMIRQVVKDGALKRMQRRERHSDLIEG